MALVVMALVAAACGKPLLREPAAQLEPPFPVPSGSQEIVEITLARTGCLGVCPVYRLELRRHAASRYLGEYYTPILGEYQAATDAEDFERLARIMLKKDFFAAEQDPVAAFDVPHVVVTALVGGRRKSITDSFKDRAYDFAELVRAIEATAGAWEWRATATRAD